MRKKLKTQLASAIICGALLTSCATVRNVPYKNEKSVVNFGCKIILPEGDVIPCVAKWQNMQNDNMPEPMRKLTDPATYTLSSVKGAKINFLFGSDQYITVSGIHDIVNLEVPAGKHVYAGDLILDTRKSAIFSEAVTIEDNFEKYQRKLLRNNKTDLELVKSLAKFKDKAN